MECQWGDDRTQTKFRKSFSEPELGEQGSSVFRRQVSGSGPKPSGEPRLSPLTRTDKKFCKLD